MSLREGMEERCAPASVERGEEHWEKARRQWTQGFPVRTEEEKLRVCSGLHFTVNADD